jgi:hypothetical protein
MRSLLPIPGWCSTPLSRFRHGPAGCVDPEPRIHWFTASSSSGLFPCPTNVVSVSRSFGKRFPRSPAVRVLPPQSSFTSSPARSLSSPDDAYQGFGPSLRHHRAASTRARDVHGLAMFRPQAFAASRRFAPQLGLRACSIPQPHPGFLHVQGLLSPCSLSSLIGKSCPHAVGRRMLTGRSRLPHPSTSTSRRFSTRSRVDGGPGSTGVLRSLPSSRFRPLQVLERRRVLRLPGAIRS